MQPPPKVDLARLDTPLQALPRASAALGVELLVKRDDLTGSALSGNKVRKLEYLLAEAVAAGADTVITCGGEQSNHARATALAAAQLGLRAVLVLRTTDPAAPPAATGNILLDRLVGAEIRWISRPQWAERDAIMATEAERLRAAGRRPLLTTDGEPLEPSERDDHSPLDALLEKERWSHFHEILAEFTDKDRTFVELYFQRGMEPDAVAAQMQISLKTVYSKKHKIRAHLVRCLEKLRGDSPIADLAAA